MTLDAWGWSSQRQTEFSEHAAAGLIPGRVVSEHRTHFGVATGAGEQVAELAGRLRNSAAQRSDLAGVGDFVALRLAGGDGPATIEEVLPRTSALVRKASGENRPQLLAANVDFVFIVTAPDGDLNMPRIERLLALVAESRAAPIIVLNKVDLAADLTANIGEIAAIAPGIPVHPITARARDGLGEIEGYFAGNRTIGLIGSSGVGKSTLTNALIGRDAQATQEVRADDSRGRHTTTHRQLFLRPRGGSIIDTPGMRGAEMWNPYKDAGSNFDDIDVVARDCKFSNCRHETEPTCAVRAAVERGDLEAAHVAQFVRRTREAMSSAR